MVKTVDENAFRVAKALSKCYAMAKYNYDIHKSYYLSKLLSEQLGRQIKVDADTEKYLIKIFEDGVKEIANYPFENKLFKERAEKYITQKFLTPNHKSVEEIASEDNVSQGTVYRIIEKGLSVIGDYMKSLAEKEEKLKGTGLW